MTPGCEFNSQRNFPRNYRVMTTGANTCMVCRSLLIAVLASWSAFAADPALLNLVVADPKVVAGIDVQRAKNSPFGQKLVASIKEDDEDFEKLLAATGFDPRRDLREVVVSSSIDNTHDRALIVATGTFDAARIGRHIQSEGGTATSYRGFDLWKGKPEEKQQGAIAFLSGSTALIGNDELVRQAIDKHLGQTQTVLDPAVASKIQEWSANNDAWFVSTTSIAPRPGTPRPGRQGTSMIPNLVPLESIQKAYAGVRFGSNVEIAGETLMRSEQDATALADVIRFAVSMIRLNQDKPGMEEMQKIADTVRVSTSGVTTRFSLAVPEDALQKMLEGKPKVTSPRKSRPEII